MMSLYCRSDRGLALAWHWKGKWNGRHLLVIAGSWLLAVPLLAIPLGLTLHWLMPPFPGSGVPPPSLSSWLDLPVKPIAIWKGELPAYRLDPRLGDDPSCLSKEDVLKGIMSITPVTINDDCELVAGVWLDVWTGRRIRNPDRVRIIETIPVRWLVGADRSLQGGNGDDRKPLALDSWMTLTPDNVGRLMATTGMVASRRGNLPIDRFSPWRNQAACHHAQLWARVKLHYRLPVSTVEREVVAEKLRDCND